MSGEKFIKAKNRVVYKVTFSLSLNARSKQIFLFNASAIKNTKEKQWIKYIDFFPIFFFFKQESGEIELVFALFF